MNRFVKAWKALRGTLKPEVFERERPVFGDPVRVELYTLYGGWKEDEWGDSQRVVRHFATCDQAHKESNGDAVYRTTALLIGGEYFTAGNLAAITVEAKPKVAKGKR